MPLSRRAALALPAVPFLMAAADPAPIRIVAAENMYGDIASQLGGTQVSVRSILNNPNQDPHLFTSSPSVAIALAKADIVIVNGADYDPWMAPLLAAQPVPHRVVITVADLIGAKPGDNPHLWYDPRAIPRLATRLTAALCRRDPAEAGFFQRNQAALLASLAPIHARIATLRARYAGTPVTATEPVFGLMAKALGLKMLNERFQIAVMNGTEPAPAELAAFENDLERRKVKILFYNSQVTDDLTARLRQIAVRSGVTVIGVTETEPAGMDYQAWMMAGLNAVQRALGPE